MKTANILVTKEGVLKLADFGLARAIAIGKILDIILKFIFNFLVTLKTVNQSVTRIELLLYGTDHQSSYLEREIIHLQLICGVLVV